MPTGRAHASALLSKVNSQLRGERVPLKSKEEDELATYLNAINTKTQQAQNFEDLGDISISSGKDGLQAAARDRRSGSSAGPSPAASKFLKKKTSQHLGSEESPIVIGGRKKVDEDAKFKSTSSSRPERSSALNKFNALTNKIQGRQGARRVVTKDSDTESELGQGHRPGSADTSVGRDGRKFLKGRKSLGGDNQVERGSPSPQSLQRSGSLEKKKKSSKKGPESTIAGEIARTLGNVYLTSEEESLAEFIQGLSISESVSKRPQNLVAKKQQKWRKKTPSRQSPTRQSPSPVRSRSPSPFKRNPSPFAAKLSRSASQDQDSDVLDSMASEMMDLPQTRHESASSEDPLNINLMDVTSLIPMSSGNKKTKKQNATNGRSKKKGSVLATSSTSLFRASSASENLSKPSKNRKDKKKSVKKSESKSSVFESLGIMMVDDLLPADPVKSADSDMSEIVTERSDIQQIKQVESESEIITLLGDKPQLVRQQIVDSEASLSLLSEHISDQSELKSSGRVYSSVGEETGTSDNYSDSFESDSRTGTQSLSHRSKRKSRRKTSYTDSYSRRTRLDSSPRRHKVVVEQREVSVTQGDLEHGTHQWGARHTGVKVSGPWGLQYTDPAPVATHVISADALETMTSYSPSVLALHEMMKTQVELIRNFADIQRRIYHSCLDGIKEDYKYTTLEDTKEFIRKNKRPKMTFKEALELVEQEEGLRA